MIKKLKTQKILFLFISNSYKFYSFTRFIIKKINQVLYSTRKSILFLSCCGVKDIFQTFQAIYLVHYERFRPSNVPENPTFMTVSERFMTVSEPYVLNKNTIPLMEFF
jgi:hypothetical protein